MTTLHTCKAILAATALFAASGSFAADMSKSDYTAEKDRIAADYKADRASCDQYSGNAKDVCQEKASGKDKVALAELEYRYTGKSGDATKAAVAKADADFAVAKEMCDDKGGNAKDVCVSEAKAAHTRAQADAKMNKKVGEARNDAAHEKDDANYQVAVQKCDRLAGDAKAACVSEAKVRFNKS
jgi:hypothetical protein